MTAVSGRDKATAGGMGNWHSPLKIRRLPLQSARRSTVCGIQSSAFIHNTVERTRAVTNPQFQLPWAQRKDPLTK
jgi:hypothetical protein